jgi:hypothetical protein
MTTMRWINLSIMGLAFLILLAIEIYGYRRWIKPYTANLSASGKLMLLLIILTMAGGFLGAFGWWLAFRNSFAWILPPLASRMLASAGWSFAFAAFLALVRPTRRRLRLILWMLAIYLTPIAAALFLFHLDRLDFSEPITYPFLLVVATLMCASIGFLFRQPNILADGAQDLVPASKLNQYWLGLVVVMTGLWSMALFATDKGPLAAIWVWPSDLLSSRLIAAMLLTITLAGIYSLPYRDTLRIMTGVTLIYGLGLSLASAWNALAGKPIKPAYLVVFGLIAIGSAIVLWADRKGASPDTPAGA